MADQKVAADEDFKLSELAYTNPAYDFKGWAKTSSGTPVENQDLWAILLLQTRKHNVRFVKVKGHADHPQNNRCDELATSAIREYRRINAMDEDS